MPRDPTDPSRRAPTAFAALSDLVLPVRCLGCGRPADAFCPACRPGTGSAAWVPVAGFRVCAAAAYDGAVAAALIRYKERDRRDLARPLGLLLARALGPVLALHDLPGARPARRAAGSVGEQGACRVVLVPVPSSAAAVRRRGGDPLGRLASVAAARSGVRRAHGVLLPTRALRDSAGLGARVRAANLDHAFVARRCPPRTAAVLVDDIVTTGATLREVGRALRSAGWPVLGAAVVAATPHRAPPDSASPGRPIGSTQGAGLASG